MPDDKVASDANSSDGSQPTQRPLETRAADHRAGIALAVGLVLANLALLVAIAI